MFSYSYGLIIRISLRCEKPYEGDPTSPGGRCVLRESISKSIVNFHERTSYKKMKIVLTQPRNLDVRTFNLINYDFKSMLCAIVLEESLTISLYC